MDATLEFGWCGFLGCGEAWQQIGRSGDDCGAAGDFAASGSARHSGYHVKILTMANADCNKVLAQCPIIFAKATEAARQGIRIALEHPNSHVSKISAANCRNNSNPRHIRPSVPEPIGAKISCLCAASGYFIHAKFQQKENHARCSCPHPRESGICRTLQASAD